MKYCHLLFLFFVSVTCFGQYPSRAQEDSIIAYLNSDTVEFANKVISQSLSLKEGSDSFKLELYKARFVQMEAIENYWYASKSLVDQGIILEHLGAPSEEVISKFKEALKYAEDHNDRTNIVWASVRISKHYFNTGALNTEEELWYTNFIKQNLDASIDGEVIKLAYQHLANRHLRFYDFKTALEYYETSFEIAKKSRHPLSAVNIAGDIVNIRNQYNDTLGVTTFIRELEEFVPENKKRVLGEFYLRLAEFNNLFNINERIAYLNKAEQSLAKNLIGVEENKIAYLKCLHFLELKNIDDLRAQLNIFEALLKSTPPTQQFYYPSQVLFLEGEYHVLTNQLSNAINYYEASLEAAEVMEAPVLYADIYKALHQTYSKIGDFEKAYFYLDLYNQQVDKVFALNKIKEIEGLLLQFDTERKQQTIENLKAKEELNAQIVEEQTKFNNSLIITIVVISVILLVLAYLYLLFRRKSKKLDQLNSLKDQVFSVLSHDLRSPLNTFKGLVTISQRKQLNAEDYQKYLDVIQSEVLNTSNFLEGILKWANANQNILPINKEDFNLLELINDTATLLQQEFKSKSAEIIIECPQDITISSDRDLLSFIIRNIAFNGLKFSSKNAQVKIYVERDQKQTSLRISDNGRGMTEEQVSAFYEGSLEAGLDATGEKSTGLGLQLCRDFTKRLNIYFSVDSQVNVGSTFKLVIPNN